MYQSNLGPVTRSKALISTPSKNMVDFGKDDFYPGCRLENRLNLLSYLKTGDVVCFDLLNESSGKPQATNVKFRKSLLSTADPRAGWGIVETTSDTKATVWSPEFGVVRLLRNRVNPSVFQMAKYFWEETTVVTNRVLFRVLPRGAMEDAYIAEYFSLFDFNKNPQKVLEVFGPFERKLPDYLRAPVAVATPQYPAEATGLSSFASIASSLLEDRSEPPLADVSAFLPDIGARYKVPASASRRGGHSAVPAHGQLQSNQGVTRHHSFRREEMRPTANSQSWVPPDDSIPYVQNDLNRGISQGLQSSHQTQAQCQTVSRDLSTSQSAESFICPSSQQPIRNDPDSFRSSGHQSSRHTHQALPVAVDQSRRTLKYLSEHRDEVVTTYGIVTSLRRNGVFVWCPGFPHLFVMFGDLRNGRFVPADEFAPFDTVFAEMKYDDYRSSAINCRVDRMFVANDDPAAPPDLLCRNFAWLDVRVAKFINRVAASLNCIDGTIDPIYMSHSAFPCHVPDIRRAIEVGEQLHVAAAENFEWEENRLHRRYAAAILPGCIKSLDQLVQLSSPERLKLFREYSDAAMSSLAQRDRTLSSQAAPSASSLPSSSHQQHDAISSVSDPSAGVAAGWAAYASSYGDRPEASSRSDCHVTPVAPTFDDPKAPQAKKGPSTGLVVTVFPDRIYIFADEFGGLVEYVSEGDAKLHVGSVMPYMTVEIDADAVTPLPSGIRRSSAGVRVVKRPFQGFESLSMVSAVVHKIIDDDEQFAILELPSSGDRVLFRRSALTDPAVRRVSDCLKLDATVSVLICRSSPAGASAELNCKWLALRLLTPHIKSLATIQEKNAYLST